MTETLTQRWTEMESPELLISQRTDSELWTRCSACERTFHVFTRKSEAKAMLLLMRGFKVHCRQRHNLIIFPAGRNLPQFQAMVERVSLPAYLAARSSRRLLATNQQFQRLMGYSASDLESLTLDDLRPPEDIPLLIESMTEFRNEGTLERRYRTKQGRLLNVRLSFYDMSLSRNEWQLPHATFVVLSDLEKTGDPRAGLYR